MMRSMFSAISGMKNHQTRMDVIGHNIANVNTTGFKSSRASFQDVLSQTLQWASPPTENMGGRNPAQVGLGMNLASIDTDFGQGSMQATGRDTDLALQGDGFFVVTDGLSRLYTRDGSFRLDANGCLVDAAGRHVQGWEADSSGQFSSLDPASLADIRITLGESTPASATTEVRWEGNLDSRAAEDSERTTSVAVFDSQGHTVNMIMTFTKTGTNEWSWQVLGPEGMDVQDPDAGQGVLTFDAEGMISDVTGDPLVLEPEGADPLIVNMDFSRVVQTAHSSTVDAPYQNGFPPGSLDSFAIDATGTVIANYTNGLNRAIGKLALASFTNQGGLVREGDNTYRSSQNSGLPQIGEAGTRARGTVNARYIELSNVDLAMEFTDMIITQRGFQANSRVISSSDEILNELVNLKR